MLESGVAGTQGRRTAPLLALSLAVMVLLGAAMGPLPTNAAPLTPGNILVSVNDSLGEYTRERAFVQGFPVPYPGGRPNFEDVNGVTVGPDLKVHVFNGRNDPLLSTLDPTTGTWTHTTFTGDTSWDSNNFGGGGVTANDTYVFASDRGVGSNPGGIIRFDLQAGTSIRFADDPPPPFASGIRQVTLGLDGLLYATPQRADRPVRIYDPDTLTLVDTVQLVFPGVSGRSDVTAAADGSLYAIFTGSSGGSGRIARYDREGNLLDSIDPGVRSLQDLELSADGLIAVTSHFRGDLVLTDLSLDSTTVFSGFGARPSVALIPIPEPSTGVLLCMGMLAMARQGPRYRRHAP